MVMSGGLLSLGNCYGNEYGICREYANNIESPPTFAKKLNLLKQTSVKPELFRWLILFGM